MFKLIGAAIIIIATTWAGFEAAKKLSMRPRQLRQLKVAMQSLEAEIMYGHTPLKEAARKLSKQMPKPLSIFFDTFANRLESGETTVKEAWDDSLKKIWQSLALKQGEFEILSQFGETLGKSDKYHQQKQIMLTMAHLEREESDALDRQGKYEKMMKSLGFLSGLLLIILLM
ncbi:stage III sporulation protein SpoIIIAB [Peribacillus sp. RS7]|jgi:stage III sporulation protein AB|uniref:stage III sporulation protein SpoIIIAB n=1 Tax=Peribacillus TaxID=2675229 RepID=UPI0025A24297|nr:MULTISPECIES: stage III sporulation protein SpoIIIAB [unclassified Peribacillus]MDM5211737.1 stage III sporulation protein SpoIIIAB [Peribacillus sp. NJ4]MDM5359657.1 stage III sporulation protein SpoIIIAB [Peribacillus sp. ACCC06369]